METGKDSERERTEIALYMCGIFFKETKFAGILGEMHEKFRRRSMV